MDAIFTAETSPRPSATASTRSTAVKDVSFALAEGQITTIVGESGSGKSTMARMVLGLMPITSGKLTFQGKDVTHLKGRDRTAVLARRPGGVPGPVLGLQPVLHRTKLLARSMGLLDERVGQERLEESLGYVGMDLSVLDRYPHQLSGGQRQRVMIARALMLRPKLLIADEATSMLDASLRVNILNVLTDLRDELGMTVLFITHDIGQACYLADRVLVMEHGIMVEQGTDRRGDLPPRARVHQGCSPTCPSCTRTSSSTSATTRPRPEIWPEPHRPSYAAAPSLTRGTGPQRVCSSGGTRPRAGVSPGSRCRSRSGSARRRPAPARTPR